MNALWAKLRTLLKKKKQPLMPRQGYRVFTQGGGWGFNITARFADREQGIFEHDGHWTPKPVRGDVMLVNMTNGKIMLSVFSEVKGSSGVDDLFFAKSRFIGYAHELPQFTQPGGMADGGQAHAV